MSQQYYYNGTQYTVPTTYTAQNVNNLYTGAVAQPLTSGYASESTGLTATVTAYTVSGTQLSSAHRSQPPVSYTYPTNAAVIAPSIAVVPNQQATIVAPPLPSSQVTTGGTSYVIANGPTSNINTNGAYTVTTSYFQQIPTGSQIQQQNIAQAAAVAAAQHAAVAAANSARGRRNIYDIRYQNQYLRKKGRTSIDSQMFYCDVCKISCAGPQTYKEHLDGQKHKKKATGTKVVVSTVTKSNQRQLRCELCDVTCTGADAYQAHIRGTKHQKTFKLHQRLGKPIPCADPLVLKATGASNENSCTVGATITKVVATPKINFIHKGAFKLSSPTDVEKPQIVPTEEPAEKVTEEHVDLNSLQERNIAPVGSEYIETTKNESGKIIQFFCKLCNCKFNDPHAKEMHLKGRRHRLQYKKKVDPSLVVDGKTGNPRNWRLQEDKIRQKQNREEFWRRRDMQARMREMQRLEYSNVANSNNYRPLSQSINHGMRYLDTLDDKHVLAKYNTIYPTEEELKTVQSVVTACEKALRHISDILFEEVNETTVTSHGTGNCTNNINSTATMSNSNTTDEHSGVTISSTMTSLSETTKINDKKEINTSERSLSGVMRVGSLANGLLLRGDLVVSLVLLCSKWPTYTLMSKVTEKLPEKLKEYLLNDKLEVSLNDEEKCILVTRKQEPLMECYIRLTSSVVREESNDGAAAVQPDDGLDRKRCLDALASLRHTKWFQAKVANLQPCLILIRILRDLCQRVPTWNPLTDWALELLVEKVISSDLIKLSPGSSLRRFFECLASGILLPGGPGIKDPCEKELQDASSILSDQDREDLTASAQHALRLIAFRQIHKVLDMDPLTPPQTNNTDDKNSNGRKRRHSDEEEPMIVGNQKKDKKEGETDESSSEETGFKKEVK